ncbi:methyl-accepting chemotaxis protein [Paenibacillaceae bacterium]|nr:methyl-accepting chemotaxis protein [Paenibacillaceae bacterium]
MKWFINLKTGAKLISSFMVIAAIMALVGLYSLNSISKMDTTLDDMYHNQLVAIRSAQQAQIAFNEMRVMVRKLHMVNDKQEIDATIQRANEARNETLTSFEILRNTRLSEGSVKALESYNQRWSDYSIVYDKAIELGKLQRKDDLLTLIDGEYTDKSVQVQAIMKELVDINSAEAEHANEKGKQLYNSVLVIMIVILSIAVVLSILFGYTIAQIISRPLRKVVAIVTNVAKGDLRETVNIHTKDEIGALGAAVDTMVGDLRQIVGNIASSSHSVAAAAEQISASTEEIASGTTHQANAAQTISELFAELSAAIHSVAANTEQASLLSDDAVAMAAEGSSVVDSSMQSMNAVSSQMARLEDDSQKIGDIIEVIEDIADQTNLLALNAAIEAARAGEQGRGFAVVADEVRKLAERSGEATKQIASIIKGMQENTRQSVTAVRESAELSRQTGESFRNISHKVDQAGQKVTEIAAASEQQAAQASTVLSAVEGISSTTEEAAASSEETATTAQSLAHLADDLQQSITIFKL